VNQRSPPKPVAICSTDFDEVPGGEFGDPLLESA
jgi:hypothetical protein